MTIREGLYRWRLVLLLAAVALFGWYRGAFTPAKPRPVLPVFGAPAAEAPAPAPAPKRPPVRIQFDMSRTDPGLEYLLEDPGGHRLAIDPTCQTRGEVLTCELVADPGWSGPVRVIAKSPGGEAPSEWVTLPDRSDR